MNPTKEAAWQIRWLAIIKKITRVGSEAEKSRLLDTLCTPSAPTVLAFANAHALNSIAHSAPFFDALKSADWVFRDGSGMATLFKLFRIEPGLNLNGTDFIPMLIERFNGRSLALFGTREPHLERALSTVKEKLAPLSSCITTDGFRDFDVYRQLAESARPELIVLGMGMPKQENVAIALRTALTYPCLIVCGGAIIDFLGGRTPRAPMWLRRSGLEWTYRLGMEPKRLFHRYVIGNPAFLARAIVLVTSRHKC